VVGGGKVALQKVGPLLSAGADVTVVSPELTGELEALRDAKRIRWIPRRYVPGDLSGAFLAFAAVDDPSLSGEVLREARERGVLFNAVDHDPHCMFHVPATLARGDLKIAISSGGKSPALAAELKTRLSAAIGEEVTRFLAALGELRPRVLSRFPSDAERRKAVFSALVRSFRWAAAFSPPDVPSPPVPQGKDPEGAAAPFTPGGRPAERGKVYLVGAGPGSGGLLTLRALQLIRTADEVHFDRLVGPEVLALIPSRTPRIFVGKEVGSSERPDTGRLLVSAARAGKAVVRLKGGDPHVFGRGGEEMLALLRAGVGFEVVPGVSALNAVPAAAGIPVTFRGISRELVVRSGYRQEEPYPPASHSGRTEGTTYLYFMTVGRLSEIVEELLSEGVDPETPAAIVQRGTLPDQEVLLAPLGQLTARAARAGLKPPAMVIAGDVVRFANWKEQLPLLEALVGGPALFGDYQEP
jgi:uroporphyrin-III C-methyltransferase/precorrin-2 dehydrogenase/sirohydrochlorin ferrochelatase